eukprot:4634852-Amphidinium_carterae.1
MRTREQCCLFAVGTYACALLMLGLHPCPQSFARPTPGSVPLPLLKGMGVGPTTIGKGQEQVLCSYGPETIVYDAQTKCSRVVPTRVVIKQFWQNVKDKLNGRRILAYGPLPHDQLTAEFLASMYPSPTIQDGSELKVFFIPKGDSMAELVESVVQVHPFVVYKNTIIRLSSFCRVAKAAALANTVVACEFDIPGLQKQATLRWKQQEQPRILSSDDMAGELAAVGTEIDNWKGAASLSNEVQFASPVMCEKLKAALDTKYEVGTITFEQSINLA